MPYVHVSVQVHNTYQFLFFVPLFPYLCILFNNLFLQCCNSLKGDIILGKKKVEICFKYFHVLQFHAFIS